MYSEKPLKLELEFSVSKGFLPSFWLKNMLMQSCLEYCLSLILASEFLSKNGSFYFTLSYSCVFVVVTVSGSVAYLF